MNLQRIQGTARLVLVSLISTLFVLANATNSHANPNPLDGVCDLDPGVHLGVDGTATNSGSQANPFAISTSSLLGEIGDCLAESSSRTTNLHYKLTRDIDLTGTDQSSLRLPIGQKFGSFERPFRGNFDGGGFHITGLSQVVPAGATGSVFLGLFGIVENATIENLEVEIAAEVLSTDSLLTVHAGGVAGKVVAGSTFSNIASEFVFLGGSTGYVGGIFGLSESLGKKRISSVSAKVSISSAAYAIGGLVAFAGWPVDITDSRVEGNIRLIGTRGTFVGGLAGRLLDAQVTNSHVVAQIQVAKDSGFDRTNHNHGGLVGSLQFGSIRQSSFQGTFEGAYDTAIYGRMGGVVAQAPMTSITGGYTPRISTAILEDNRVAGVLSSAATGTNYAAGILGDGSGVTVNRNVFVGEVITPDRAGILGVTNTSNGVPVTGFSDNFFLSETMTKAWDYNIFNLPDSSIGARLTSSTYNNIGTYTNFNISADPNSSSIWLMCDTPILRSSGSGCDSEPVGGYTVGNTQVFKTIFSQPVSSLPSPSVIELRSSGAPLSSVGAFTSGLAGMFVQGSLSRAPLKTETLSFDYLPSTGNEFRASSSGRAISASAELVMVNSSTLAGPVATLNQVQVTPTSVLASLSCGGACGSGDSYSYVASITPLGGSTTTISGVAAIATTNLSFTGLNPNLSHLIRASVSYGGVESATSSLSVSTPKPIATISALTIADTTATLTVGCTNCGAAPDSFTISATPAAGGATITTNTNVISGLTSETTYSFSVVVAYAGTTSDLVLWQNGPVMTLPFVPIISSVTPGSVPLTGGSITVTGSNFTTSSLLTLDGASLAFTIVSGTEITFTAPSDTPGSYDLAITNPVGTYTLSSAISYVSGPTLTTISPALATTNGGTIVTLTGTDLSTTTQVNVGSTTVSFSVISNTVVRFTTAATSAGIVDIGLVTVGGADTLSNAIEFTTSALIPVVSSITPTSGTNAGGTTITVTGQYFSGSYSDSVSAAINGISGSSVILIDDSTLTFVAPPGAAASGLDVSVATGGGVGILAGVFTYTAPPAGGSGGSAITLNTPEILLFSTREIAASGGEVTATGRRLEDISVLTLGGISVTIVSNTDTSVTFTTGEMPVGVWDLRLVGSSGTLTFQQAITVTERAIVSESTGELLGWTWTLKFTGNSRSLSEAQQNNLRLRLTRFEDAETIICWGYTTAANPNAWAIAHATKRAQAACDFALANQGNVKTVVRLRYGVSKDYAMRSALQFWK